MHLMARRFYKFFLSPLFWAMGARCRFKTSCGDFFFKSVARSGWLRGTHFGLRRLSRCRPGG